MIMLKFLLCLFLVEIIYASHATFQPTRGRILNGTAAEEGEFPFAVSLRLPLYGNIHDCGASILNKNFVLTAAHCVSCDENGTSTADPNEYNIQYGLVNITKDDTNSVDIKKIHCNNFTMIQEDNYFETLYDIAILELATPLPNDGSWAPVTLSRVFNSTVQQQGVVIGWGVMDDHMTEMATVLQKLTLDVYNDTVCGAASRGDWDHHVCVGLDGYGGPCYGDSGTAALIDGVQIGLTSYTTTIPPTCGHGNATNPSVYSRIEKYFDWILDITPDVVTN